MGWSSKKGPPCRSKLWIFLSISNLRYGTHGAIQRLHFIASQVYGDKAKSFGGVRCLIVSRKFFLGWNNNRFLLHIDIKME